MKSLVRSEHGVDPPFLYRFLRENHSSSPSMYTHKHNLAHIDKKLNAHFENVHSQASRHLDCRCELSYTSRAFEKCGDRYVKCKSLGY